MNLRFIQSSDEKYQWLDDLDSVRKLMLLLTAYEHLDCKFTNGDGSADFGQYAGQTKRTTQSEGIRGKCLLFCTMFSLWKRSPCRPGSRILWMFFWMQSHIRRLKGTEGEAIPRQLDVWRILWDLKSKSRSTYEDMSGGGASGTASFVRAVTVHP
jgi:hypothetical protein